MRIRNFRDPCQGVESRTRGDFGIHNGGLTIMVLEGRDAEYSTKQENIAVLPQGSGFVLLEPGPAVEKLSEEGSSTSAGRDPFPDAGKSSAWKKEVLRSADLLYLGFEGINLELRVRGKELPCLDKIDPDKQAYLIVHFPPQNIAEQAFYETAEFSPLPGDPDRSTGGSENPRLPARSVAAGPSRLVFAIPEKALPIPYTLESLLGCISEFPLQVAPGALPPEEPVQAIIANPLTRGIGKITTVADLIGGKPFLASQSTPVTGKTPITARDLSSSLPSYANSAIGPHLPRSYDKDLVEAIEHGWILKPPPLRAPGYHDQGKGIPPETAIELPYHLILSPHVLEGWIHAVKSPVPSQEPPGGNPPPRGRRLSPGKTRWTELWHTRLGIRLADSDGIFQGIDETDPRFRTLRAIWTTDWPRSGPVPPLQGLHDSVPPADPGTPYRPFQPFRTSLDMLDRENIVHLTSDYALLDRNTKSYRPVPVEVNRLMLSSLGAWFDARGAWDPGNASWPPPATGEPESQRLTVEEWRHVASMGRDHFARVVYRGHLVPFGHRASLVKVTERKFHPGEEGKPRPASAVLRQRMFIVVREPERIYYETGLVNDTGRSLDRQFPFTSVRILTAMTPPLNSPTNQDGFWPEVSGTYFKFHMVAEDIQGKKVEFHLPLFFTTGSAIPDYSSGDLNTCPVGGQPIAFAASSTAGDTDLDVHSITFGAETLNPAQYQTLADIYRSPDIPGYYPALKKARVTIPSVKKIVDDTSEKWISFDRVYLESGFQPGINSAQVFVKFDDPPLPLSFGNGGRGDRAGALVQPDLSITGVSRLMGPVAGEVQGETIPSLTGPGSTFDLKEFLPDAKLFGAISLVDIIENFGLDGALDEIPRFITEKLGAVQLFLKDLEDFHKLLEDFLNRVPGLAGTLPPDVVSQLASLLTAVKSSVQGVLDALIDAVSSGQFPEPADLEAKISSVLDNCTDLKEKLPALLNVDDEELRDLAAKTLQIIDRTEKTIGKTIGEVTEFVGRLRNLLNDLSEMRIRYTWKVPLKKWPETNPVFDAELNGRAAALSLDIDLRMKSALHKEPFVDIRCKVSDFAIALLPPVVPLIRLEFKKIEFVSQTGKKADVSADLGPTKFEGPLRFIQKLQDWIPGDGFSDPPEISVTSEGIKAGYSLAIPPVSLGMFSLQNIKIGSALEVPFIGKSITVRFNFCERQEPFHLTVSMFGGGGFFGLVADPSGLQLIEAALEFGASVSMDFGVASGGISAMGGIYYCGTMEDWPGGGREVLVTEFSGYFRVNGEVDVLHIISASIELYLALFYEYGGLENKCWGEAELTIEIEVFLFSIDVSIHCRKTFSGGSPAPPTFGDLMENYPKDGILVKPWMVYCHAFAPVPEVI